MSAHDTNESRIKFQRGVGRSIERYQGKLALLHTWQTVDGASKEYLQHLRREAGKLRDQLRVKGVIFGDVDEL